jgi:hypothetical protein
MKWTTEIVEQRWIEACVLPTIARWASLESLATMLANIIVKEDFDNIAVAALRGVAAEANRRKIAMQPLEEDDAE